MVGILRQGSDILEISCDSFDFLIDIKLTTFYSAQVPVSIVLFVKINTP